jgi:hypothetical protein
MALCWEGLKCVEFVIDHPRDNKAPVHCEVKLLQQSTNPKPPTLSSDYPSFRAWAVLNFCWRSMKWHSKAYLLEQVYKRLTNHLAPWILSMHQSILVDLIEMEQLSRPTPKWITCSRSASPVEVCLQIALIMRDRLYLLTLKRRSYPLKIHHIGFWKAQTGSSREKQGYKIW